MSWLDYLSSQDFCFDHANKIVFTGFYSIFYVVKCTFLDVKHTFLDVKCRIAGSSFWFSCGFFPFFQTFHPIMPLFTHPDDVTPDLVRTKRVVMRPVRRFCDGMDAVKYIDVRQL